MDIRFCGAARHVTGAARHVTGSMFLLESRDHSILVDCGMSQGEDEKDCGTSFPFSPSSIDFVLLTHAHIDHSGRLPQLVKEGFSGTIYATPGERGRMEKQEEQT